MRELTGSGTIHMRYHIILPILIWLRFPASNHSIQWFPSLHSVWANFLSALSRKVEVSRWQIKLVSLHLCKSLKHCYRSLVTFLLKYWATEVHDFQNNLKAQFLACAHRGHKASQHYTSAPNFANDSEEPFSPFSTFQIKWINSCFLLSMKWNNQECHTQEMKIFHC